MMEVLPGMFLLAPGASVAEAAQEGGARVVLSPSDMEQHRDLRFIKVPCDPTSAADAGNMCRSLLRLYNKNIACMAVVQAPLLLAAWLMHLCLPHLSLVEIEDLLEANFQKRLPPGQLSRIKAWLASSEKS